jgi:type VI secretion system secreted protein Hcp
MPETKMAPSASHSDFFLKIGDIKGESQDDKHKGEVDLLSFNFGVQQSVSIGSASTGAGAGKSQFHEMHITKRVDSSSAKLFLACASGAHYTEATLTCRRAGGTQAEYLKIKLETVFISKYELGSEENDSNKLPVDRISLNFGKISYNYKAQNADGSEGANTMTGWDLLANKKV